MLTRCAHVRRRSIMRSGVIPYTVINNKLFFLFGIDAAHNELTDFGGGVKKNETVVTGGLREFNEESRGIFSNIFNFNDIQPCITLYNETMAIIFIPLQPKWFYLAEDLFYRFRYDCKDFNEMKGVIWIDSESLARDYITEQERVRTKMWIKVKSFFKENFSKIAEDKLVDTFNLVKF